MNNTSPASRTIDAFNTAAASENRIHDDATAKRFGFTGALVPGVEVYAYMCHMPVARWGRAFLERGTAECRFAKPIYHGDATTVSATPTAEGLDIRVEARGEGSAHGTAALVHDAVAPALASFPSVSPRGERPPASFISLPEGDTLGIAPLTITTAMRDAYLVDIREDDPLYRNDGLVHPGQILRLCNAALVENVVLGPWIHVGSRVQNFAAARVDDELTLRARIVSNVETKGHCIVTLDALVVANGQAAVARVEHVAIWRPRQVAEAA